MQFSRRSNFTIKNVFLILLSFFLISYLAKLGDFLSFSGLITPIVFSILFFLFFFFEKEKIKINLVDIFLVFSVFYSLLSVFFNEITAEHFMLIMQFNILAIGSYFMIRFIAFDRNDVKLLNWFRITGKSNNELPTEHTKNIVSTKNVESDRLIPIFSTRSTNGSRRYASIIPATNGIKTELRV